MTPHDDVLIDEIQENIFKRINDCKYIDSDNKKMAKILVLCGIEDVEEKRRRRGD